MTRALRVVLDTNVVISALVFTHGRLGYLRHCWQTSRCEPLVSATTITELLRTLAYPKFKLSEPDQQELFADYLPYCTAVKMPIKLPKTPRCRDPFDVPFLQLAIVGKADHLVTGDKDLLLLAKTFSRSIISPDRLIDLLKEQ